MSRRRETSDSAESERTAPKVCSDKQNVSGGRLSNSSSRARPQSIAPPASSSPNQSSHVSRSREVPNSDQQHSNVPKTTSQVDEISLQNYEAASRRPGIQQWSSSGNGPQLPMHISQGFFQNANNTSIKNSHFHAVTNVGHTGIQILSGKISVAAMHDSSARYPPPKCHPNTRVSAIKSIITFVKDPKLKKSVMWVNAPFGHGKSAAMQTVVEQLEEEDLMQYVGGTFFFGRDDPQRNRAHLLLPTIVYQIAHNIPGMLEPISQAISADPTLPSKSIKAQLVPLLVIPFARWVRPSGMTHTPTIFIDGLDECDTPAAQRSVLKMILDVVENYQLPLRFVVASRPEHHITDDFESDALSAITLSYELDDDYLKMVEFLRDEFRRIRQSRRREITIPEDWPSDDVIHNLVRRASSQYLFATVVIRFVEYSYKDPRRQLEIILSTNAESSSAFSSMDELYIRILSNVPAQDQGHLRRILAILVTCRPAAGYYSRRLSIASLADLLDLDSLIILGILHQLRAVVAVGELPNLESNYSMTMISKFWSPGVSLLHISFDEFLVDKSRAGKYYIDTTTTQHVIIQRVDVLLSAFLSDLPATMHRTTLGAVKNIIAFRRVGINLEDLFPLLDGQYKKIINTYCSYGTIPSSSTHAAVFSLLRHTDDLHLKTSSFGGELPFDLMCAAMRQKFSQSAHTYGFPDIARHFSLRLTDACQQPHLVNRELLDFVDYYADFLRFDHYEKPARLHIDFTSEAITCMRTESLSGRGLYSSFRESKILQLHTIYGRFLNNDKDLIHFPGEDIENGYLLKSWDQYPSSALPSLLQVICSERSLARLSFNLKKNMWTSFLAFIIGNAQVAGKLGHLFEGLSVDLRCLIKSLIEFGAITEVLNEFRIDSIWSRRNYTMLFTAFGQEPWRSYLSPQDYAVVLNLSSELIGIEIEYGLMMKSLYGNYATGHYIPWFVHLCRADPVKIAYMSSVEIAMELASHFCKDESRIKTLLKTLRTWRQPFTNAPAKRREELEKAIRSLKSMLREK